MSSGVGGEATVAPDDLHLDQRVLVTRRQDLERPRPGAPGRDAGDDDAARRCRAGWHDVSPQRMDPTALGVGDRDGAATGAHDHVQRHPQGLRSEHVHPQGAAPMSWDGDAPAGGGGDLAVLGVHEDVRDGDGAVRVVDLDGGQVAGGPRAADEPGAPGGAGQT